MDAMSRQIFMPKPKPAEGDAVKHPPHYTKYKMQPRRFAHLNNLEFWVGNTIKYIMRAGDKVYDGLSPFESEIRDLEKAIETVQDRLRYVKERGPIE